MGIILTCDEPELQIRYGPDWGLGIDYGDNGGVLGKADDSDQPEDNQAPLEDEKVADDNPQQEEQNDNQGQDSGCKVGRWGIC